VGSAAPTLHFPAADVSPNFGLAQSLAQMTKAEIDSFESIFGDTGRAAATQFALARI